MSLHNRVNKNKVQKEPTIKTEETLRLSLEESEILLFLIANGNFKGTEIETVYKLAVKLQVAKDNLK